MLLPISQVSLQNLDAPIKKSRSPNELPPVGRSSKMKTGFKFFGAGDGTRTRACELGKLVPYHLATPAQDLMLAQHQQ